MTTTRYEVQTCSRCDRPISCSRNLIGKVDTLPRMGVAVTVGFSNGGWGRRQNHVDYSAEVCGDCYEQIIALCRPVIEHLQNTGKRPSDNVQPVRSDELELERREIPLLRKM